MAWRTLITGATGVLGQEIIKRLHQREFDYVAACCQERSAEFDIKYLSIDYSCPALLELAFREVDVLFLLIPLAETMLSWAENAIVAAHQAGVKVIVRSSVMGADPKSSYLWLRTEGEINQMLASSHVPSVIVQASGFMQNFARYYGRALSQGALCLSEGEGRVSFVDVGDVASVLTEVLVNPFRHLGGCYTLTGGRALSNAEVCSILSLHAGRRISYVPITEQLTRSALVRLGFSDWWIEFMLSRHRAVREGAMALVTQDFFKLTERVPREFEDYAKDLADSLDVIVERYRGSNLQEGWL